MKSNEKFLDIWNTRVINKNTCVCVCVCLYIYTYIATCREMRTEWKMSWMFGTHVSSTIHCVYLQVLNDWFVVFQLFTICISCTALNVKD
jgi:hypothetical protein